MTNAINIKNIPYRSINTRCITLISQYTRQAYKYDGTVISMQSENVLEVISLHANTAKSSELSSIYSLLKLELSLHLEDTLFTHTGKQYQYKDKESGSYLFQRLTNDH